MIKMEYKKVLREWGQDQEKKQQKNHRDLDQHWEGSSRGWGACRALPGLEITSRQSFLELYLRLRLYCRESWWSPSTSFLPSPATQVTVSVSHSYVSSGLCKCCHISKKQNHIINVLSGPHGYLFSYLFFQFTLWFFFECLLCTKYSPRSL